MENIQTPRVSGGKLLVICLRTELPPATNMTSQHPELGRAHDKSVSGSTKQINLSSFSSWGPDHDPAASRPTVFSCQTED